jgi:hypothetical protein
MLADVVGDGARSALGQDCNGSSRKCSGAHSTLLLGNGVPVPGSDALHLW